MNFNMVNAPYFSIQIHLIGVIVGPDVPHPLSTIPLGTPLFGFPFSRADDALDYNCGRCAEPASIFFRLEMNHVPSGTQLIARPRPVCHT
jgi:hypothetical protein